jgi:hypothetical protein
LDKVPAKTQSASRTVRDEEETIGGKGDGGVKSSTGNWGKRQRRIAAAAGMEATGRGKGKGTGAAEGSASTSGSSRNSNIGA